MDFLVTIITFSNKKPFVEAKILLFGVICLIPLINKAKMKKDRCSSCETPDEIVEKFHS